MDPIERAAELVRALRAAGLNATDDPGAVTNLMRPGAGTGAGCVLVVPLPELTDSTLCGEWVATWQIVAMAPRQKGRFPAHRLVELATGVAEVLPITVARPSSYALEEGTPAYPAYIMTMED